MVTTISDRYATAFGFTEEEVFKALDDTGFGGEKQCVKEWYEGSNKLVNSLVREGDSEIKQTMETLLQGKSFRAEIDEQIVFDQLDGEINAIWSLLLDDRKAMNYYMNEVALKTFSSFDTGNKPSPKAEPERFYHGFVLGLMVELSNRYTITSNRESGFGRYDIMLKPKNNTEDAIIMEFKVHDAEDEKTLQDTVDAALLQIEEKCYVTSLVTEGIPEKRIRKYGFAFRGKECLIGGK